MTEANYDLAPIGPQKTSVPSERIRQRAYELWERNHCPPGLEMRFWLLAERQLQAEAGSTTAEGEGT